MKIWWLYTAEAVGECSKLWLTSSPGWRNGLLGKTGILIAGTGLCPTTPWKAGKQAKVSLLWRLTSAAHALPSSVWEYLCSGSDDVNGKELGTAVSPQPGTGLIPQEVPDEQTTAPVALCVIRRDNSAVHHWPWPAGAAVRSGARWQHVLVRSYAWRPPPLLTTVIGCKIMHNDRRGLV